MRRIEPPQLGSEIFGMTMKSLETGLKVSDIATFGLLSCSADEDAAEVMKRADLLPFDCIPVRDTERVVGVLERDGDAASGPARERMRVLDEGLLVSASEPLKRFIPLLVESPHRLVVRGARIEGIVTRSDVHKLPVRLLAFALVTHLEMMMANLITRRSDDDAWKAKLSKNRQKRVMDKFERLHTENFDPPLIEVTDFCDKRDVLVKMGILTGTSQRKVIEEFKRVEGLRNSVAHAATYAQSEQQFFEFVELLHMTEAWIERLSAVDSAADEPSM